MVIWFMCKRRGNCSRLTLMRRAERCGELRWCWRTTSELPIIRLRSSRLHRKECSSTLLARPRGLQNLFGSTALVRRSPLAFRRTYTKHSLCPRMDRNWHTQSTVKSGFTTCFGTSPHASHHGLLQVWHRYAYGLVGLATANMFCTRDAPEIQLANCS